MGRLEHGSCKGPFCSHGLSPPPSPVHFSVLLSPPEGSVGRVRQCRATQSAPQYLVLLSTLPFLLNLLLLLQFLRHAGLPQGLALASFVCFGVEGRLQGCVSSHAGHHLLSQLSRSRGERAGSRWESFPKQRPGSWTASTALLPVSGAEWGLYKALHRSRPCFWYVKGLSRAKSTQHFQRR